MSDSPNPMKCPRRETDLEYVGTKAFHEGTRWVSSANSASCSSTRSGSTFASASGVGGSSCSSMASVKSFVHTDAEPAAARA